jgi:hypothetical protein
MNTAVRGGPGSKVTGADGTGNRVLRRAAATDWKAAFDAVTQDEDRAAQSGPSVAAAIAPVAAAIAPVAAEGIDGQRAVPQHQRRVGVEAPPMAMVLFVNGANWTTILVADVLPLAVSEFTWSIAARSDPGPVSLLLVTV